jgi:transcription-repair coupling factor (superfamily II helicase)
MYKRIASARDAQELREIQVEMIDRFGLLPDAARNLFRIAELKQLALPLGIRKLELGAEQGRIVFAPEPAIDSARLITLIQHEPNRYRLSGGDRLQFALPRGDLNQRIQAVYELLEVISLRRAVASAH